MANVLDNIDFSEEAIKWDKILNDRGLYYYEKSRKLNNQELDKLQQEIIFNHDPALAYFFANTFDYKKHLMQRVIIEACDPKYALLFAKNINHADIKALQDVVVDSNKIEYICKFACFIKNCNIKVLEKLIIKSKKGKYIHMYLKHISDKNIIDFKNIIFESKKPRYVFELAKSLKTLKDIKKAETLIIESGSFTYIRLFAEKIKKANIERLEQAILATNNEKEIKKFAKNVKKSKMSKFLMIG